jgi:hypothetical protein
MKALGDAGLAATGFPAVFPGCGNCELPFILERIKQMIQQRLLARANKIIARPTASARNWWTQALFWKMVCKGAPGDGAKSGDIAFCRVSLMSSAHGLNSQ